jgi:hypothetical protein
VGGLWAIGYWRTSAVCLAGRQNADRMLATGCYWIAYVGMGCGVYLLIHRLAVFGGSALKQGFFWAVLVMLLLTAAIHFGIQPILAGLKEQALPKEVMESMFRDRFARWHGISSIGYLIESLLGLVLVLGIHRLPS